jgi:hypothetical protein
MGTRNLTMVIDQEGTTKIAQYGQWDGYPEGQGSTTLKFLKTKGNLEKLIANLPKVRFIDFEGKDKEFVEAYQKNAPRWSNEPDNRTVEQKRWFDVYMTRDLGAEILHSVAYSVDDEILLKDESDFGLDTVMCEWVYVIDLQKSKFIVLNDLKSEPLKTFSLKRLPSLKTFLKAFQRNEE